MKKIVSIAFMTLMFMSVSLKSQTNLVWTLNNKFDPKSEKPMLAFNTNLKGFTNKEVAKSAVEVIKKNDYVSSCVVSNEDKNGNCDLLFNMKSGREISFYVSLAKKMGVTHIVINGQKKTIEEFNSENKH